MSDAFSQTEKFYWLALSRFGKIGSRKWQKLLSVCGSIEKVFSADAKTLRAADLREETLVEFLKMRNGLAKNDELSALQKAGVSALFFSEPNYPRLLKEIPDAPPVLYYKGNIDFLNSPALAVVGTRKVSAYGKRVTPELVKPAARAGVAIISGLALGVDGLAHEAALAAGGKTAAALACGLDTIYPANHFFLAQKIIENGGVLLSEHPPGVRPFKSHFPLRNRIVAGLAAATLVVEAPERSGALITAYLALDYNRGVLAVPGNIGERNSGGTNKLLKLGASPAIDAQSVLEFFPEAVVQTNAPAAAQPVSESEKHLLGLLAEGPLHIDDIIRKSGLNTSSTSEILTVLEMRDLVQDVGGGVYRAA